MKYMYVYVSRDQYSGAGIYTNYDDTMRGARSNRAWLKDQGCPVGPVVRVPIPSKPKRKAKR